MKSINYVGCTVAFMEITPDIPYAYESHIKSKLAIHAVCDARYARSHPLEYVDNHVVTNKPVIAET